jgi:hypothetical protein
MALNNYDQARIREYLLGRLSDEEQEKIEEQLMVNDDLFDELEASKCELIEEYSSGELSQTDRESLEGGYLVSPEGRQRYTFARALGRLEQRRQPKPAPTTVPPSVGLFDQIRAFFNWRGWALAGGSAAILLAAAIWFSFPRSPVFVSVDLTSNVANRAPGARQYHPVTVPSNVNQVRFSLHLPESSPPRAGYVVELDNQTETTTFKPLAQDQTHVVVAIPANKLPPGLYAFRLQATLSDGTTQHEPWEYYIKVTN